VGKTRECKNEWRMEQIKEITKEQMKGKTNKQ
jgi:hypothetical protein